VLVPVFVDVGSRGAVHHDSLLCSTFFRAVVAVCLCWRRDDPDTWLHGACAMWLEGMVLDDTLSVVYSNATPSVPLPAGDLKCDVCGEAVRC
jgi:hypothetical protein